MKIEINRRKMRHIRIRKKISGNTEIPRMSIFRSNKYIYVQVINDQSNETLLSCNSDESGIKSVKGDDSVDKSSKCLDAFKVGILIAERCKKIGIKKVVFDRGGYKYHGRVKALAQGAREKGMEF
jgi:large subunit ribosomal protein L18